MMNYKEIIQNLDTEKIKKMLDNLHIPYQEKENYLLCKTMCHHINEEDASWKLYYYFDTHIFYCYSNCEGMSIFNFLKHFYEIREIDYDWYSDIYQVILDCSNFVQESFDKNIKYKSIKENYTINKIKKLPIFNKGILDTFIKKYPIEWIEEGISKESMDKFNILYSISQNKIIIPHYNVEDNLVGIRGRALNEWEIENLGKYMPVQIENKWYSHPLSLNLYGLNKTKENIIKNKICYIFESEKSVMKVESYSIDNCSVAICGSNFNKYAFKILLKECKPKEVILCLDKEELPGEDKYFFKLLNICKKYNKYCNFSFIYDRDNLLELKDAPVDKGEKVFLKLLSKRVKVN